MSVNIPQKEIPFRIKSLTTQQASMALVGRPWNERVMGIEPTLEAWEAAVLPLNYTRINPHLRPPCLSQAAMQPGYIRLPG